MEDPKKIRVNIEPAQADEPLDNIEEDAPLHAGNNDKACEPSDAAGNEAAALKKKLDETEKESKAYQERFLRAHADLENYRKRMAREMEDFRKYSHDSFARDILPVMDNLERALESADSDDPKVRALVDGVEMIKKELSKVLEKHGVTCVEAHGKPFDPCFHQAVSQQPSGDHPENTVISEFQRGYLIGDRLLRPAMVVVSAGAEKTEKDNGKTQDADVSDACET